MKIILSHDVDHLNWKEHYFRDLYLPGTLYRNTRALLNGSIDIKLYIKRLRLRGNINSLSDLVKFYEQKELKATFFFGMANALKLSYHHKEAAPWIKMLIENGHDVGVHGIEVKNGKNIKYEYESFKQLSGLESFGIRTHYLRLSGYTYSQFEQEGYTFDSSVQGLFFPFKIGSMWEIPISIMDASLVKNFMTNLNEEEWKSKSQNVLESAEKMGLPYFVINVHDNYLSPEYNTIKSWYVNLVEDLQNKGYEFITFKEAVAELQSK
ncbi:MAG: hypothetical protein GC181_03680 [Bacteroidetes bacterium]|nr:hypothetical protein [Bacteroidota bacterium]